MDNTADNVQEQIEQLDINDVEIENDKQKLKELVKSDHMNEQIEQLHAKGFNYKQHIHFVKTINDNKDTLSYCGTEHLRIQGVFWAIGTMDMLGKKDEMPIKDIVEWTMQCYYPDVGGFGGNIGHDPHLLYTQHAIYILAQCNALDRVDAEAVATFIGSLQNEDGSFNGDKWGEIDTRFSYCAIAALKVLNQMDKINLKNALQFIVSCQNFDGGFGSVPGAESHAGYIFTAVGALSIGNGLDLISKKDWDKLAWWLSERQCDSGGLNGRPEKQADVCYSWWVLSTLFILNRIDWINSEMLKQFIMKCQDPLGGIADRPKNVGDIYHTFFGITGLCILQFFDEKNTVINPIDPVYALPEHLTKSLQLTSQTLKN